MEQKLADTTFPAAKNDPDDIMIRKLRDTLVSGGLAVIAFGIWTVIRSVLEISKVIGGVLNGMAYEGLTDAQMQALRDMVSDKALLYGTIGVLIVLMVIDLVIRIYVGLSARATGLQKKKKNGKERNGIAWIIFGILLMIVDVYSLISSVMEAGVTVANTSILYFVIQTFVEVTSLFISTELVITGIRLRGLMDNQIDT